MKALIIALLAGLFPVIAFTQSKISKTYPVTDRQKINFKFDYPKIIHISSWDKKEVSVEATVKINDGHNDSAFTLNQTSADGVISISNKIDMDQIPESYYAVLDGVKTHFNSKAELDSYIDQHTGNNKRLSSYQQRDIQVTVEIKVPADAITNLRSVYGLVELAQVRGPITIEATYGGIDASLNKENIGQIKLTNRYGKIYSDLDLKPTTQTEQSFYTSITASPGKGPSYDISSSYGNIYLRNENK